MGGVKGGHQIAFHLGGFVDDMYFLLATELPLFQKALDSAFGAVYRKVVAHGNHIEPLHVVAVLVGYKNRFDGGWGKPGTVQAFGVVADPDAGIK